MRKAFLKKSRETLEGMRTHLLRNVQHELHEGRESNKDEGMDTYDLASDARDREISHILTDRDREKLQAIDEALSRVDDGSYGLCEDCGAEIAEGRLQALPFTRLCVTCQSDRERESRMNKRYEEDRTSRRLGMGDGNDEGES
jgi:DnaK suppressor protein